MSLAGRVNYEERLGKGAEVDWCRREVDTWKGRCRGLEQSKAALREQVDAGKALQEQLGAQLEVVRADRQKYCQVLKTLTYRHDVQFEETPVMAWTIGATSEEDWGWREVKTGVVGDQTLMWRTVSIGLTNPGARTSFRDIGFEVKTADRRHSLDFLPLEETESDLRGLVVFNPPIGSARARKWEYSYKWPGMWDNLRRVGEDLCQITVEGGQVARISSIQVSITFPPGAIDIRLTADAGSVRIPRNHPLTRTWKLDRPPPAVYELRLGMRPFPTSAPPRAAR